jgi:hypothetical protein
VIGGRKGSAKMRVCPLFSDGTSVQVGVGEHGSVSGKLFIHKLISTVITINNYDNRIIN